MEKGTTAILLQTTTTYNTSARQPRRRESRVMTDERRLQLSPIGRRNKMRIEGHRGMGRYEAENTLKSFARSCDEQLDGIELDVWLTKDQIPVVIHALTIDGEGGFVAFDDGSKKQVFEMTLKETRAQTILNGNTIPLLDEVFALAKNKVCVNVEFKGHDLNGAMEVLKLCKAHDNIEQVQFSSFNWKFAEALDTAREELGITTRPPFGFLTETVEITEAYSLGKMGDGVTFGWELIKNNMDVFPEVAKEIIKNGYKLKVYFSFRLQEIYNDYDLMDTFEVDTVITNEPFLMKRYYEKEPIQAC